MKVYRIIAIGCLVLMLTLCACSPTEAGADPEADPAVQNELESETGTAGDPVGNQNLFLVRNPDTTVGYIDQSGELVIPIHFLDGKDFSEGMAAVILDEGWGYINTAGETVIEGPFVSANDFTDGLAAVQYDNESTGWGYIDTTGEPAFERRFRLALPFNEDRAVVILGLETGYETAYIDGTGEFITETRYEYGNPFSGGLAAVKQDGLWGMINQSGDMVCESRYDYILAYDPDSGLAQTETDGLWGFINGTGEMVIEAQYGLVHGFSNGLAPARVAYDEWGYIDTDGDWAIPAHYELADAFSEGLAGVQVDGLCGFIDTNGEMVIEPKFDSVYHEGFNNGLAIVFGYDDSSQTWGYIDKSGEYIWGPVEGLFFLD